MTLFGEYNYMYKTLRLTCRLLGLTGKQMDTSSILETFQEMPATVSVTTMEWNSAQQKKAQANIVQTVIKEAGGTKGKQEISKSK